MLRRRTTWGAPQKASREHEHHNGSMRINFCGSSDELDGRHRSLPELCRHPVMVQRPACLFLQDQPIREIRAPVLDSHAGIDRSSPDRGAFRSLERIDTPVAASWRIDLLFSYGGRYL